MNPCKTLVIPEQQFNDYYTDPYLPYFTFGKFLSFWSWNNGTANCWSLWTTSELFVTWHCCSHYCSIQHVDFSFWHLASIVQFFLYRQRVIALWVTRLTIMTWLTPCYGVSLVSHSLISCDTFCAWVLVISDLSVSWLPFVFHVLWQISGDP